MKTKIILCLSLLLACVACGNTNMADNEFQVNKKMHAKEAVMNEIKHYSNLEFDKVIYLDDSIMQLLIKNDFRFRSKDPKLAIAVDVKTKMPKNDSDVFYRFFIIDDKDGAMIINRETLNPYYIDVADVAKISFKDIKGHEYVFDTNEYFRLIESYNHLNLRKENVSDLAYQEDMIGELNISFKDQHNLRMSLYENENIILHDGVSYMIYNEEFYKVVKSLCH